MTESDAATISSAQTLFMKFVFPPLWIGGFVIATLVMFLVPRSQWRAPADAQTKWFFLFATIVGTIFIWWGCIRLKRVRMDAQALYISNYRTEIIVPFGNVSEITENRWVNTHPVTIHFHSDTEFGSQVTFMPKVRWFGGWSSHPVVAEIRQAVDRATGRNRGL